MFMRERMVEWRGGTKRLEDGSGRRQPVILAQVAWGPYRAHFRTAGAGGALIAPSSKHLSCSVLCPHNHQIIDRKYRAGHI